MKKPSLKLKIYGLLTVYMLAWFTQSWMPFFQSDIFANERKATTNIVALMVDKNLYNGSLKNSIDWYATNYIQQKISNSKAVIFPLDTETIKARDIVKMLENIYYDGIEKEPTTLKGVILIGNKIPLPVVNDNGTIFPTIFPYTDFDDPKYYREPKSQFFVPNNIPKAQAEIRQSMINVGSQSEDYISFFEKLKQYNTNPTAYIGNKVWYDDFIDQQASFNKNNLANYINKFIFAEDFAYHRYNPVALDFFNKKNNTRTQNLTQSLSNLTGESGSYANQVGSVFSGLLADYNSNSGGTQNNTTPTVFVDDAIKGFQKSYQDLYGITSTARMRDNILAAGRWDTNQIDSHTSKIEYYDQLYTKKLGESKVPFLVELNKQLEDKIIAVVKQKQYPLHIGIPVNGTIEKHSYTKLRSGTTLSQTDIDEFINTFANIPGTTNNYPNKYYKAGIYEAFYYGKNASTITGIDQTSIFVGTPNPINNNIDNIGTLTGNDTTRGIGSSYGILSQFVEANRGYVPNLAQSDLVQLNNGACANIPESVRFLGYVHGALGGNTPLNLTGANDGFELVNKRYDRGGIANWIIANFASLGISGIFQAGSIFNIAGSKRVGTLQPRMIANNMQGGFLQRVVFEDIEYHPIRFGDKRRKVWKRVDICNLTQTDAEPLSAHDITSNTGLYQTGYAKYLKINGMPLLTTATPCPSNPSSGSTCYPITNMPQIPAGEYIQKQELNYKTIDSLSIHNAPNPQQINTLENTTADRPIDSVRYLSFKGIGGDRIKFEFPNLYNIPIYKTDVNNSGSLYLKSPIEIEQSIRNYLQDIVIQYNNNITNQITKQPNYFNSHSILFTTLGIADPLATPARPYTLIDTNILNNSISNEIVSTIAQILYTENSLLPKKRITTTLSEELDQLETVSSITNKKKNVIQNYITKNTPSTPLSLPGYQDKGYELISLTSNGDDSITSLQEPAAVRGAQNLIDDYTAYQSEFNSDQYGTQEQDALKDACASKYGEPVPLVNLGDMSFPWFDMFACRLQRIGKPKVTFDFKNAQGPVLTDGFFKDFITNPLSNEQYTISDSSLTNNQPTSEEKEIIDAVSIDISPTSYLLDPTTPIELQPQITIEYNNNTFGSFSVSLLSSGNNCIIINNTNLCTQGYTKIIGANTIPLILPITLQTKKSGYSDLIVKICKNNTTTCALQTYSINIVPSTVHTIDIRTPYDNILTASPVPIVLQAKDEYNNTIPFSLLPYKLATSTGTFPGGRSIIISDFRETQELQGTTGSGVIATNLTITDKNNTLINSKQVSFAPGKIKVTAEDTYFSASNNKITYTLPKKKSLVYINKEHTNIGLLPKLTLELKNKLNEDTLAGPIIVKSEKGIFDIYKIEGFSSNIVGNTGLEFTNAIIFNGEKEHIILKPKGKSNIDNLVFIYPDGSEEKIQVEILASLSATQVKIIPDNTIDNNLLPINSALQVQLYVYDDRGNLVTTPTLVKSDSYGSLSFSGNNTKTTLIPAGGSTSISLKTDNNGGAGYIVSKIISENQTIPGLWKTKVEESIIPTGNINGLYLNIMGTARGDITTDTHNNYNLIPNIFKSSQKLLISTTQLSDPNKLKTTVLQISNNGTTQGEEANNRIIIQRNGKVIAQNIVSQSEVYLGQTTDLTRSNTINESSITYPNNTDIISTLSWSAGSTNSDKIITLIDRTSTYKPNKISSIEDSIDSNKNIGWRNNQEHLTQFGQGKSVGEATMINASEFLINYGDPLITRLSNNILLSGANVDDGPGQVIVNDPTRTIIKSLSIDINNDGLKDIVTVFSNGDVIWSKQYGGKQLFVDMGPLLKIFGTINNVFGVNAQGDGFDDIMVEGEGQTLRIYTNKLGVFDVDGFPVCINTQEQQANSLVNIDQWFVEDMDNDDLSDIVINQDGQVKIIYGGVVSNGYSYISQQHDSCDQNWSLRQTNSIKTIETLATQISEGNTVDSSLLHWKGLIQTADSVSVSGNIEDTTINSTLENQINQALQSPIPNFNNLPIQEITNQASSNLMRRSVSPIDYLPDYETATAENIRYITTSQLTTQDQVRVYKKYQDINGGILKKNDIVKVTVSILGLRNEPMTYIDRIQGPWIVKMNNNGVISGRNNGTLPMSAFYKSIDPQGGFMFAVDNITLGANNATDFSYLLTYQGGASTKITISDRNNDEYKDISVYPLDGCSRFFRSFINNKSLIRNYRDYNKTFVDLDKKLTDYTTATQQNSQNYISGMTNAIQNIATATGTDAATINSILNSAGSEQMQFGSFLQDTLANSLGEGGTSVNLNVQLLGDFDQEVSNTIKKGLDQICNGGGGEQSCGSGLPIPFNMAFLSPGEFNIMGCKPKIPQIDKIFPKDSGFPVFAFPATFYLPTPAGPVPIPLPFPFGGLFKGATDEYGYFNFPSSGGPYPSQIRIYLSPTLTQQMGMAICMGPQVAGSKIPAPFSALGGNCIVTKVSMPTSSCTNNDPNGEGNLSDQDLLDLSEFGTCTQGKSIQTNSIGETLPQSPFKLVSYNNGTLGNPFPDGTYFGIINFEKTPIVLGEENNNDGIVLQGGKEVHPQVQGGSKKSKGLVACIVNDRLDRQTNYIINNFTNMQIGVYLPDLSQIGEGFENLGDQLNENDNATGNINTFFNNFGSSGDGINNNIDTFSGNLMQTVRNYSINQSSLQDLSNGINNPFDQLAKMFEQTPLVRINTVDVPVSIPMIYAEDIAKYESYLKTRIERNKQILKDWESIVQGTLGVCGKNYSFTPSTATSNTPILNQQFLNGLSQKLKAEKLELESINQKLSICEENNWLATDPNCISLMQRFGVDIMNIKTIKSSFLSRQKVNTQCFGLLFDPNGDLNLTFKNLFSIMENSSTLENNIRANIKTLDQYKRFPLQLYQWVHVVDRYLSEITTTVDNFLGSLTLWLHTNATRFEQYVDAIITISTALQTWQAILDLSVDRQKKCSTCTVDNYDAYACSLGFLCGKIKLPILKLPPFKIPNIYIDLSHIDVGMDINLPKFQFTPTSVPLVELPNLPQPPSIIINGDLNAADLEKISFLLEKLSAGIGAQIPLSIPTIPLLPSPPTLPELPSFIPNINIELPVLPPAPKIPKIAPEIETVINAVSFFSDLYCIVKGGVGLVGESNVKTRIEQLTQRTYEIPLFDNINLSKDMSYQQDKLEGFDFQIDAYVNFTMNFNGIYTMIQGLANNINKQTKKLTQREGDAKQALSKLNENAQDINNTTQQNITLDNPLGFTDKDQVESLSNEQKNINKVAQFLINDDRTPLEKKDKISGLLQRIDTKAQFNPQTDHILALQKEINSSINASRQSLSSLQNQIKNYDTFVDTFSQNTDNNYTIYSGKNTFSTTLFDGNTTIIKENNNNVMKDYIGLQKTLLSHYKKGLTQVVNNQNKDMVTKINNDINYLEKGLQISEDMYSNQSQSQQQLLALQNTYNAEQNLIYNNQAATCSSLGNLTTTSSTTTLAQGDTINNTYPYFGATAQVGGTSTTTSSTTTSTTNNLYDFSEYKNKLMLPFPNTSGTGSTYVNIVRSDYFTNNNKGYERIDVNNDNEKDILRRDTKNVWIKYGKQNTSHVLPITNTTTNRYVAPVWNTANQREEDTNDGYLSINSIKIKVHNKDRSVKNLRVRSQDYDSFTLSWTNSERQQSVDGYLLEINKIPDLYHLKGHNDVPTDMKSRYVLFVPEGKKNLDGYLSIKNQLSTKSFDDLLTGILLDIVEYKTTNNTISYSFTDIPRAWYYTRIVSLQTQGDSEQPIYSPSSPRSHHVVAGQQIIADTQGPSPEIQLQRLMTNTIVDSGLSPQGLVNTRYNILIQWEDPNGVIDNWIENSSGQILSQLSGNTNILSGLYFDQNTIKNYHIGARDHNNNITREQLNLTINIPTISLDDIIYENTPTNGINILSSITQGMDDGVVKFERKRNNVRTLLSNNTTTQGFSYPLVINQTTITGGLYNQSQNISFFAPNGNIIATMNKDNGAITITPAYSERISKKVDLTSNTPVITLYDTIENRNIFTIKQNSKNPQLTAQYPYEIINLSGAIYGGFSGGTCIRGPEHNCMVIAAPNGLIVIPAPYHTSLLGNYNYANNTTTINFNTPTGESVGSISFNAFIK